MSDVNDKASEIAKNIWLAGLGAYGKAFDEAQGRIDKAQDKIDKASKEPTRLFKELVRKGEKLEDEVRDSLATIRKSGTSSVEERISRVRENFSLSLPARADQLADISRKLDELTAKVDALSAGLGQAGGARPAAKAKTRAKAKSRAARKTPAKAKRAPRKKAATRKS